MLCGLLFLYIYVFFGVAVITNTFIAIVEQGFSETKSRNRFDWAKKINRKEEQQPAQIEEDKEMTGRASNSILGRALSFREDNR